MISILRETTFNRDSIIRGRSKKSSGTNLGALIEASVQEEKLPSKREKLFKISLYPSRSARPA